MNIVITSQELPGINDGGGIGVYVLSWAEMLHNQGHNVRIVTLDPGKAVNLNQFPMKVDLIQTDPHFGHGALAYSYALYQHIRRLTHELHWDLIEFPDYLGEGYFTIKAKRLRGEFSGTVLRVHGHMSLELCDTINQEIPQQDRLLTYHMERYAMQYCDVLSVPARDLETQYRQFIDRNIIVTRHPLPHLPKTPLSRQNEAVYEESDPILLYVGRLEYRKGVDLLIKAAIMLWEQGTSFQLWLIGKDTLYQHESYQKLLERLIPSIYRTRVRFVGGVARDQLYEFYRQATAVVFPSRFENWPNVCLEAMALGCPIIASKAGGMREMLAHGAGILINPEHTPSFAMAIDHILKDTNVRNELANSAQQALAQLTIDPNKILEQVVNTTVPPAVSVDVHHWPKVSVLIEERLKDVDDALHKTMESLHQSGYPDLEIVPIRAKPFTTLDEWCPQGSVHGEFVLWLQAGERVTGSFLTDAVSILQRHLDIDAVYPMVTVAGQSDSCYVVSEGNVEQILLPAGSLIRPVLRYDTWVQHIPENLVMHPDDSTAIWRLMIQLIKSGMVAEMIPVLGVENVKGATMPFMRRLWWEADDELFGHAGRNLAIWTSKMCDETSLLAKDSGEFQDFLHYLGRHILHYLPKGVASRVKKVVKRFTR